MNDPNVNARPADLDYAALEKALRDQIIRQPDLLLTRLMLLELLFKVGRRDAFLAEARKLRRRVGNPRTSLEWQRCARLGRLVEPTTELFRSGSAELLDAAEVATAASAATGPARTWRDWGA